MASLNIFNPNFNTDRYTTVAVNDGARRYAFLFSYLGELNEQPMFVMYWPDFEPTAFGFNVNYRVTISHWDATKKVDDVDVIVTPKDAIAMVPFRYEQNNYNEFTPLNWEPNTGPEDTDEEYVELWPEKMVPPTDTWYYISVKPWIGDIETGRPDRGYVGAQAAFNILNSFNLELREEIKDLGNSNTPGSGGEDEIVFNEIPNSAQLVIVAYQGQHIMSMDDLKKEVADLYGLKVTKIYTKTTMYLADEENVYGYCDVEFPQSPDENTPCPPCTCPCPNKDDWESMLDPKPEDFLSTWYPSMRLFGWLKFYTINEYNEQVNLIGYRTNMIPVTQPMWCFWMDEEGHGATRVISGVRFMGHNNFNLRFKSTMSNFPRITNNTIQQVTNVSRTDSKAGIVQPVFVRVRDLAKIVVHPAVTENICINLDAYKSSVKKFMIRIEGCTFKETARTSSGVVFKVVGNQLQGTLKSGTYYILNQDEELVTSGKYQYEY